MNWTGYGWKRRVAPVSRNRSLFVRPSKERFPSNSSLLMLFVVQIGISGDLRRFVVRNQTGPGKLDGLEVSAGGSLGA